MITISDAFVHFSYSTYSITLNYFKWRSPDYKELYVNILMALLQYQSNHTLNWGRAIELKSISCTLIQIFIEHLYIVYEDVANLCKQTK